MKLGLLTFSQHCCSKKFNVDGDREASENIGL